MQGFVKIFDEAGMVWYIKDIGSGAFMPDLWSLFQEEDDV